MFIGFTDLKLINENYTSSLVVIYPKSCLKNFLVQVYSIVMGQSLLLGLDGTLKTKCVEILEF